MSREYFNGDPGTAAARLATTADGSCAAHGVEHAAQAIVRARLANRATRSTGRDMSIAVARNFTGETTRTGFDYRSLVIHPTVRRR